MVENYKFGIKIMKWWKKFIFYIINIVIVNFYILYKENCSFNNVMVQRYFRRKFVEQFIQSFGGSIIILFGRFVFRVLERFIGRYFLDKLMEGEKFFYRQCIVCGLVEREMLFLLRLGEKRKRRCGYMISYKCRQCNVSLCIFFCFEIYYIKQEFFLVYKRSRLSLNFLIEE